MDLLSAVLAMAFGLALGAWLWTCAMALLGAERQREPLVLCTVILALVGVVFLANERWGTPPKYRADCADWRERYEDATTLLDLERARDGLREGGCSIAEA
ncbi:hypothetical protein BZG35_09525 [Brevundimonas sp. LM2]|nr:hypothetical protein BZG35_09525 [Brevundimonas sp. LM2]